MVERFYFNIDQNVSHLLLYKESVRKLSESVSVYSQEEFSKLLCTVCPVVRLCAIGGCNRLQEGVATHVLGPVGAYTIQLYC